jgi:hypothetical protein
VRRVHAQTSPRAAQSRAAALVAVACGLIACRGQGGSEAPTAKASASAAASIAAPSVSSIASPASSASSAMAAGPAASASGALVASATASASAVAKLPPLSPGDPCNVLRGPLQLPFTGPAAVSPRGDARPEDDARIFMNRDGLAFVVTLPEPPPRRAPAPKAPADNPGAIATAPPRVRQKEPAERSTAPGCVFAGGFVHCMAMSGTVHRTTLNGDGDAAIAAGRPGSSLAATLLDGKPLLGFLADRKTTEGVVTMAFASLDGGPATQVSEDGSGATFITLAPRGEKVVAMYIDARRALMPLHARVLGADGGRLRVGTDAVLFVGDGTESRPIGALALGESGPAFGLLPTFKDVTTFGVAAIRIDEQPRDDAPITWSTLPGGLDRAPIAATQGVTPVRIALVRPAVNEKAKRALELGEIDPTGAYKPLCVAAESSKFSDVSLTADRFGTVWLAYTDAEGTWIERRGKAR